MSFLKQLKCKQLMLQIHHIKKKLFISTNQVYYILGKLIMTFKFYEINFI